MRTTLFQCPFFAILILLSGCGRPPSAEHADPVQGVPSWPAEAIWYQTMAERFWNGDPSNDPTLNDIEGTWPYLHPEGWAPTAWTHDWYEPDDWAAATGEDISVTVHSRRYGGDLQGILDKLDYLEDLGITALFLNPVMDSPSMSKYHPRYYQHIDRNFGPDPEGDRSLIATEVQTDPSTWRWTAADSLYLVLIDELHERGMRIIMDVPWNHTGMMFWAWQDVLQKQEASPYADWYEIKRFDDPSTPDNEFAYEGWAGVPELPNLTKVGVPEGFHGGPVDGDLHPGPKEHIFAVTRRWLDPDNDGDPSDGVDGFRLDAAEQVPLGFWRDFRTLVKGINRDAYLVGEIWWEKWPEKMMDPRPYLGDVFDAVMNYRWYMPTRSFFGKAHPQLTASAYVAHLDSIEAGIASKRLRTMMNLTASHDSPRFATSIQNPGRYKYRVKPNEDPGYDVGPPTSATVRKQKLIIVQQFTNRGAPHIWYGDEVGMWGGDDPDNRKPMVWDDLSYEDERYRYTGVMGTAYPVQADSDLRAFYRQLIALRKANMELFAYGDVDYILADDENRLLGYTRSKDEQVALVLFNAGQDQARVEASVPAGTYRDALKRGSPTATDGILAIDLPAMTAAVLVKE